MAPRSPTIRLVAAGFFLSTGAHLLGASVWPADEDTLVEGAPEIAFAAIGSSFEDLVEAGGALNPVEPDPAETPEMLEEARKPEVEDVKPPTAEDVTEPVKAAQSLTEAPVTVRAVAPLPAPETPVVPVGTEAALLPLMAPTPVVETNAQSDLDAYIPAKPDPEAPSRQEIERNETGAAISALNVLSARVASPQIQQAQIAVQTAALTTPVPDIMPEAPVEVRPAPEPAGTPDHPPEIVPAESTPVEPVKPLEEIKPQETLKDIRPQEAEATEIEVAAVVPTRQIEVPRERPDYTPPPEPERVEKKKPVRKKAAKPKNTSSGRSKGNADVTAKKGQKDGRKNATAAANNTGKGKSREAGNASVSSFNGMVRRKIQKRYRKVRRAVGIATISFRIAANGSLAGVRIRKSSGNSKIDNAALAAVRRAAPFGKPPGNSARSFSVPIGQKK